MYLKRIEISGFKSFANRICLDFTKGITCIVGPNGSGKSNISDAVRWVLGEQSSKQLRGSSMQDVIFSGTQSRRPQGSAYVAITIDNSDRSLASDCDEVTVSRRVYRSGESEYRLNGADCRLRDISELFYDTGIGREGYSIIGQGQIDQIVSGRPEERRELLDEAAGIVKFKKRKADAVKKLENEEGNLVRVTDILGELSKQVEPLRLQSEKAKTYLSLRDELRLADVRVFLLESEINDARIAQTKENADIVKAELDSSRETASSWKDRYDRLLADTDELNSRIEDCRSSAAEAGVQKENLEGRIRILQEQIHTEEINDEHYGVMLKSLEDTEKSRRAEKADLLSQKNQLNLQIDQLDDDVTRKTDSLEELDDQIRELEFKVNRQKQDIIDTLNLKADVTGRLQRCDTLLEQSNARKEQLEALAAEAAGSRKALEDDSLSQKQTLSELNQEYDRIREQGSRAAHAESETRAREKALQSQLSRKESDLQSLNARLESLRNLAERYEGYGSSVRRVMEIKDRHPDIIGVVADLIETDKKYETAIETALGNSVQNVVTRSEQCARDLISYLKTNKYGRVTFLPLESLRSVNEFREKGALKEPGAIGPADQLVREKTGCEGLSAWLLGRVLVVDDMDHALAIARKYHYSVRMVTLDGELLSVGGSITGGTYRNSSNLLGRRREIEELTRQQKSAKEQCDRTAEELHAVSEQAESLKDQMAQLTERSHECRLRQNTAEMNLRQTEERIADIDASCSEYAGQLEQIQDQMSQILSTRKEFQSEQDTLEERGRDLNDLTSEGSSSLEEKRQEREEKAQDLSEAQMNFSALSQKSDFLMENITRINQELSDCQSQRVEIERGIQQAKSSVSDKQSQIVTTRQELADQDEKNRTLEAEAVRLTQLRDEQTAGQKEFIEKRDALLEEINRLDKEAYRLQTQLEKYDEQRRSLINYIWNEYELTPVAARNLIPESGSSDSPAKIRNQAQELKRRIRDLGDVNVGAIEEFADVSGRYEFLKTQYDDLTQAKSSLEGVISELDAGMRRQFNEKFGQIQTEFNNVFRELFGGGAAALILTDEQDPLNSGVQINAQPPGKKLQNMMQLSGGEKALTAISLLFAIQSLKPSPFCLLDEIEAALDDSNVDRFSNYLGRLTDRTQFILITHRRGTMLKADRLYGITMQEKGVSTLVSVSLTDEPEQEQDA